MKRQVRTQEDLFPKYHAPETVSIRNMLLEILVFVLSLVIGVFCITQYRCIWKMLSYKPVSEEEALEKAIEMKTSVATKMTVLSDSVYEKDVAAGTPIKVLGAYMRDLSYRNDEYHNLSPRNYTPGQYYYIELADGTRGAAMLPEALIGRRMVITKGDDAGDTLTVSSVKKNKSNDTYPFDYYAEGKKTPYHWGEFSCMNEEVKMVVYSCPLLNVPKEKLWKVTWVPPFMKIPVYMRGGFFLFPRFKSWHAFLIVPLARWAISIAVWLLLLFLARWILSDVGIKLGLLARDKFMPDMTLSKDEVYKKAVGYFDRHYLIHESVASCLFTPIIMLITSNRKFFYNFICDSITMRCPKCGHEIRKKKTDAPQETEVKMLAPTPHRVLKKGRSGYSENDYELIQPIYTYNEYVDNLHRYCNITHVNKGTEVKTTIAEFCYYCYECDYEQCQWEVVSEQRKELSEDYTIRDGKRYDIIRH